MRNISNEIKLLNSKVKSNNKKSFFFLRGGYYCFAFDKISKDYFLDRFIVYPTIRKKMFYFFVKDLYFLLPRLKLNYDNKQIGNLIIFGNKIKSFNFNTKEVYTFTKNKDKIKKIIKINNISQKFFNSPKVLDYGKDYLVEEFKTKISSIHNFSKENWKIIIKLFKKLVKFYEYNGIEEKNKLLYTTVHGDFTLTNFGYKRNKVFLFDWDNYHKNTILYDFFSLLFVPYTLGIKKPLMSLFYQNEHTKFTKKILEIFHNKYNIYKNINNYYVFFLKRKIKLHRTFRDHFVAEYLLSSIHKYNLIDL